MSSDRPIPTDLVTDEPLAGIRILDFTTGVAGPAAMQMAAFLGAEVIRVSSELQRRGPQGDEDPMIHVFQLNKMSALLNLRDPRGLELAKRLVAVSDVMMENMRPGSMQRLGMGYEALREVKREIIAISLSSSGYGGPDRDVGYAPNFVGRSGLASLSGYPDGPPAEFVNWPDIISAHWVIYSLMYALLHREQTGEGQYLDLSAIESLTTLLGDQLMEPVMNGRDPERRGNRDELHAPHDVYRASDGGWVAVAVTTEEEWRALCAALARANLADDARLATAEGRRAHADEVDAALEAWTGERPRAAAVEALQAAGIAASAVENNADLLADPQLAAYGRYVEVEHAKQGRKTVMGPPWTLSATPARVRSPAPLVGEHIPYVFGELLGLDEAEIATLREEGVLQ